MQFLETNLNKFLVLAVVLLSVSMAARHDSQFWQGVLTGSLSAFYLLINPRGNDPKV